MNNFGLGLVLSFTDNATSGIQKATGAFNALDRAVDGVVQATSKDQVLLQFAYSAGVMGNELYSVGRKITSVFTNAINSVVNIGDTMNNAQQQLTALYGSAEIGEQALKKTQDYAMKSVYSFNELISSVVTLKASGINAFAELSTSAYKATNGVEGASQTILDYASDLAAFKPNMRNAYGTGVQAALGAFNEYIAEGNARALKSGASLDILSIIGEDEIGETASERARQIADMVDKLGMVGMTASMANTPMQKLANIQDLLYNTMSKIAQSGVYEKFTELIGKVAQYLFEIPDSEIDSLAYVISSAIVELMEPLEKLLDVVITIADKVREILKENPELVKNIVKYTAMIGVISSVGGIALKLLSTLGMLRFSMSKLFGGSVLGAGSKLLGLFKNILFYIGPIIAATFLLKAAWDNNFLDMQNTVKNFVANTIDTLRLLFDAITDNTLSEEGFKRAQELGILPFIEAILQLKYHLGFLFEGMKEGFKAFSDTLSDILIKTGLLDKDTHGLRDTITKLIEKITQPGMTDTWKEVGHWIGYIGGWALVIIAVLPKIVKVISIIVSLVSTIVKVVKVISEIVSVITGSTAILIAIAVAIQAVWTALVIGVFIYTITHWEKVKAFIKEIIKNIIDFIMEKVDIVKNFIKEKLPFVAFMFKVYMTIYSIIFKIIGIVVTIVAKIMSICFTIQKFILTVVVGLVLVIISEIIKAYNIVKTVVEAVAKFFYAVYEVIRTVVLAVALFIFTIAKWIYENIIQPLVEDWLTGAKEIFDYWLIGATAIYNWLLEKIINPLKKVVAELVDDWKVGFQAICDFVMPILEKIQSAISSIVESFQLGWGMIGDFWQGVGDKFKGWGDELESGFVGLATGGYVNTTGLAVLHPNEVVVNDVLTQRLGQFLDDYQTTKTSTALSVQDDTPWSSPIQSYVNNTTSGDSYSNADYTETVIFETGSIVFNVDKDTDLANMSEAELEAVAEKLMKKMARKAQIRQMQTRK